MNLYSIETGQFRLDGGAMFGVVPKPLWEKTNPSDEKNRIYMAMRCLLVEDGARLILIDNGLGHKYNDKFKGLYAVDHAHSTLEGSLNKVGFSLSDVTDVVLTHLHFDHCGGSTKWNASGEKAEIVFEKAIHWIQKSHFEWALHPNAREKASFFEENLKPLVENENLKLLDGEMELYPNFSLRVFNGHTEGQQCPLISINGKRVLYAADVIPTFGHIPLPYVMGYDVRPLVTMEERTLLFPWLAKEEVIVFFEHDPYHEVGLITQNEKGGFVCGATGLLKDFI